MSGFLALAALVLALGARGGVLIFFVEPTVVRMHASYSIPPPDPPPSFWGYEQEAEPALDFKSFLLDVRVHDYISSSSRSWLQGEGRWSGKDWSRMIRARVSAILPAVVAFAALVLFCLTRWLWRLRATVRAIAALTGAGAVAMLGLCLASAGGDSMVILTHSGGIACVLEATITPPNRVVVNSPPFKLGPFEYGTFIGRRGTPVALVWQRTTRIEAFLWPFVAAFSAYPAAWLFTGPVRAWCRRRRGLCLNCGYNLTGNTTGVCPECAASVDSHRPCGDVVEGETVASSSSDGRAG